MIVYELTRGLAYQRIKHPGAHWYARTLPIALTIVWVSALFLLPRQPDLLGKDGLVAGSLSILSTLPGFYFAGLAAVATFAGLNMDAAMPAPTPSLMVKVAGAVQDVPLSRRQFLSYLFAYLVLISALLCVIALLAAALTPSLYLARAKVLQMTHGALFWGVLKGIGITGYLGLCSSMIITTLQGIFFLTERIHQP